MVVVEFGATKVRMPVKRKKERACKGRLAESHVNLAPQGGAVG
jgi:hypothetical protein